MKKYLLNQFFICSLLFATIFNCQSFGQDDSAKQKEEQFVFPHVLNRLFSVQNSKIMNSLDLSLQLGGSFGFENNNGFVGTLGLGLGGYGDIELSSESLIGSMFNSTENFTNIGMKIKILSEEEKIPSLAVGIKTNNNWNSSNHDDHFLMTNETGLYTAGLRGANYDSRMTSVYAALGKSFPLGISLNAGIELSDLRYKNVYIIFNEGNSFYENNRTERQTVVNFFGGIEYYLNNRTSFMIEAQSVSYLKVSTIDGKLSPSKRIVGVTGLRFFITKWLLLDSGVRYQDDYTGLADAEFRIGLNGIWNLGF